jgi:hypothetical protein
VPLFTNDGRVAPRHTPDGFEIDAYGSDLPRIRYGHPND